tara:strand:+ start:273 stop:506 length:234 start_codon:yes stop_codon:yes gene_type:complete
MQKKSKQSTPMNLVHFDKVTIDSLFEEKVQRAHSEFATTDYSKLLQDIDAHDYRGPSKKSHNGAVPIRPTDSKLLQK